MRLTLEQLKAMTPFEVKQVWRGGDFPFDHVADCHSCMTGHHPGYAWGCGSHPQLSDAIATIVASFHDILEPNTLYAHLEEFYALRLFYDSLYPQTVEATPQTEQAIAESCISTELVAKSA
jgi:hypothetical protein